MLGARLKVEVLTKKGLTKIEPGQYPDIYNIFILELFITLGGVGTHLRS